MPTKPIPKSRTIAVEPAPRALNEPAAGRPRRVASARETSPAPMAIYGGTPNGFLAVASTTTTLMCGLGEDSEERKVLVPYLQLQFRTPDDLDADPADATYSNVFEGNLAYENVAFLLMDLARDIRGATRQLTDFSSGTLKPEKSRVEYSAACLKSARGSLETAITLLDELAVASTSPAKPAASTKRLRPPASK